MDVHHTFRNLKFEVEQILLTVTALEERYGMGYLINILQGQQTFLRNESHATLSCFGALSTATRDHLRRLITLMLKEEYLLVSDPRYGILQLSEKGHGFLKSPLDMYVDPKAIQESGFERALRARLKDIRKHFATEEGKPPFRIFTDHTLEALLESKPQSVEDLLLIPGMAHYKVNRYGPAILQSFLNLEEQKADFLRTQLLRRVATPSHQAVKTMFESGLSVEEIAQRRQVKPSTVNSALLALHQAGDVNLKPWIEHTLPQEVLERGAEWFREKESPRLQEAFETLGLDYDTLRLCRLYVADFHSSEIELSKAS